MPRYFKLEKKTSRGTLAHDIAVDGKVLHQRMRRGVNVKTGKVGGGRASSRSTFPTEAAAKAAFEKRVKELLAERFVQVGGPPLGIAPKSKSVSSGGIVVKGTPKPARAEALDAFESKHGVPLPPSYRRFVMKYGAGELLGFVRIHVPRAKGRYRLESLVGAARHELEPLGMFPFADSGGGDLFGWPRGARVKEPAVLHLERGRDRAKKIAPDFDAFVRGLTTSQRFVERLFVDLDADATYLCR